ncbi:YsnF/AvaK domain-containing protein [Paracoccus jeotgali]|uniref:YsnF/AvaK domain-containing protein n=1 Tax=Paracoccus jeotgali TaxID=2065379 RepID=UPI0028A6E7DA|nr:YsnF/AvaK domain-containing protein [Paracoccus jeotgali]
MTKMTYDNQAGTRQTSYLSAMFDSAAEAQRAVDRLVDAGIPMTNIRQVAHADSAASGAIAVDGEKGFWESLGDFFFPDEDRYAYAEGLSRGGSLVTVSGLSEASYETALVILDDEGSVNMDERVESWRSEGWGGYEESPYAAAAASTAPTGQAGMATGAGASGLRASDDLEGEDTVQVVEERLRVGKRQTDHGRVRVRTYVVEEPVSETVELREEHVEIERRPVDRAVGDADRAFQDRTIEAEEYREEAVVEKEARVVEEIGLRKTSDTHQETVSDSVRHTEVEVERDDRSDADCDRLDPLKRDEQDPRF